MMPAFEPIGNSPAKVEAYPERSWSRSSMARPNLISEEELGQVVAYLQYLKKGKLPKRTSQDAAPVGAPNAVESLGNVPPPPPMNPIPPKGDK